MSHANARLTPAGRRILIDWIAAGRPVAHVAAEMGISATTAWRWWRRWQEEGPAGLIDRSSRPRSCPHRTAPCLETRIRIARFFSHRGPLVIARVTDSATGSVTFFQTPKVLSYQRLRVHTSVASPLDSKTVALFSHRSAR